MKVKKQLKGASTLGIRVQRDKSLNKFSGKNMFPEKLKEANRIIANLKWAN